MSLIYKEGNILDSNADIICHQVNCRGAMNSGVAKAIRQKWPQVFDQYWNAHIDEYDEMNNVTATFKHMLGHIQSVYIGDGQKDRAVINMFAQEGYGYDGRRYTSYDAFWSCLGEIKKYMKPGITIAFPARIGCVRGGADWDVIQTMIDKVLGLDFNVEIWDFDRG